MGSTIVKPSVNYHAVKPSLQKVGEDFKRLDGPSPTSRIHDTGGIEFTRDFSSDFDKSVNVKLCVYKGRSANSEEQAFLLLTPKDGKPLAVGLAPEGGAKPRYTSHAAAVLKDCEAYLNKNNVRQFDLSLSRDQLGTLLCQLEMDRHGLNRGAGNLKPEALDRVIERFGRARLPVEKLTPNADALGKGYCPARGSNSAAYLAQTLEQSGVHIPRALASPRALWRYLDAEGLPLPTKTGLPVPQSMTTGEYLSAHLSGRSAHGFAEIARQSMSILQEIRDDLQTTFIDPPKKQGADGLYVGVDVDLLNRAPEMLDRLATNLKKLTEVTAYGYQKMLGRPDETFYAPTGEVSIDEKMSPAASDVKVYLCAYPARGKHREGQTFLSFESNGQQKFAVSFEPTSGPAGRLEGAFGHTRGVVTDVSYQLGKKATTRKELTLTPRQISALLSQINQDAQDSGSTLKIKNIGGLTPQAQADDALGLNTRYKANAVATLPGLHHNNSSDYVRRLLAHVGVEDEDLSKTSSPRTLAALLPDRGHDHERGELYIPQSMTFGQRLHIDGLNQGLPNLYKGIHAAMDDVADNILTLSEELGLVEEAPSEHDSNEWLSFVIDSLRTGNTVLQSDPAFRRFARSNIDTINRMMLTLSRDFQIMAGEQPLLPKIEASANDSDGALALVDPFEPGESLGGLQKTLRLATRHKKQMPELLEKTLEQQQAIAAVVREDLAKPLHNFKAGFDDKQVSISGIIKQSLNPYAPAAPLVKANEMRKTMTQGAERAHKLSREIGHAVTHNLHGMVSDKTTSRLMRTGG